MPTWLSSLFSHYGYLVIVVAVLLENAGIPAPGHTALLAGGVLANQHQLSLGWVIVTGALAAIVGDNIGYWVGRRKGRDFLERHCRRLHMTEARMRAIDDFYARHGNKTVFIARFITGLQTVAALFAGVSGMPWRAFFLYNCTGAFVWAAIYGEAGYLFGASWQLVEKWVGNSGLVLLALLLVAIFVAVIVHRRRRAGSAAPIPAVLVSREVFFGLGVVAVLAIFAIIAEGVVYHESQGFDVSVSIAVHRAGPPVLDGIMRFFTFIGSVPVIVVVTGVVAFLCYRRQQHRAWQTLIGITIIDEATNGILKVAFARPRPFLFADVPQLHSYSFPSGHAMAATAIYGMSAVIIARLFPRARGPLAVLLPPVVLLIGFSRIYLGFHWTTDVLGGFTAGAFFLLVGIYFLDVDTGRRNERE